MFLVFIKVKNSANLSISEAKEDLMALDHYHTGGSELYLLNECT